MVLERERVGRLTKETVFLVLDVPLQLVVIYTSFSYSLLTEYRGIIVITLIKLIAIKPHYSKN